MKFDEFKNKVMKDMKKYLTDEYKDYNMKYQTITKSSGVVYEALMIGPKDCKSSVVPALNVTEAYNDYVEGKPMEDIMKHLADIRMNAKLPDFNKEDMFEYAKVEDRIFPRLVNTAANKEYLADKPRKDIEDLSLIYAVRVTEDAQGFAEAVISNDLAEMWGVSAQEIYDQAMVNIGERPPLFQNIESLLFGDREEIEIEDVDVDKYRMPFFILTNQQKTKGAVMAVNPKTMDRITAKFGEVYIIPSSVDETIIVPKSEVKDVHELERMVKQVNASDVRPEDQLSDNVYEYDPETHSLKIAGGGQTESEDNDQVLEEDQDGPEISM